MITQPVLPRIPLALQASGGVTIDPVSGLVSINLNALTAVNASALLTLATAALPSADPHVVGEWWNNGGVPSISQG